MGFLWDVCDISYDVYRNSIGFLWYFKGISMEFLWDFYGMSVVYIEGMSMVFYWYFQGISMVFLWYFSGISMEFVFDFCRISKEFLCFFFGISGEFVWNSHGKILNPWLYLPDHAYPSAWQNLQTIKKIRSGRGVAYIYIYMN